MASAGPVVVSDESSNSSSVLVNNPSFYLKRMASNSSRNNTSFFRSAVSDSELDNTGVSTYYNIKMVIFNLIPVLCVRRHNIKIFFSIKCVVTGREKENDPSRNIQCSEKIRFYYY